MYTLDKPTNCLYPLATCRIFFSDSRINPILIEAQLEQLLFLVFLALAFPSLNSLIVDRIGIV